MHHLCEMRFRLVCLLARSAGAGSCSHALTLASYIHMHMAQSGEETSKRVPLIQKINRGACVFQLLVVVGCGMM